MIHLNQGRTHSLPARPKAVLPIGSRKLSEGRDTVLIWMAYHPFFGSVSRTGSVPRQSQKEVSRFAKSPLTNPPLRMDVL